MIKNIKIIIADYDAVRKRDLFSGDVCVSVCGWVVVCVWL